MGPPAPMLLEARPKPSEQYFQSNCFSSRAPCHSAPPGCCPCQFFCLENPSEFCPCVSNSEKPSQTLSPCQMHWPGSVISCPPPTPNIFCKFLAAFILLLVIISSSLYYQSLVHPHVDRAEAFFRGPVLGAWPLAWENRKSCFLVSFGVFDWILFKWILLLGLPLYWRRQAKVLKSLCIYKNSLGNLGLNLCTCKLQLERFLQITYYPIRELKNKSK